MNPHSLIFRISARVLVISAFLLVGGLRNAESQGSWQAQWDKTVDAAKKEGQVVLYHSTGFDLMFQEFHKKYPEIEVITVPGLGYQIGPRIMAERRAGKYLADLYFGGSGTPYNYFYRSRSLDSIQSALILPEVLDTSKWWSGKFLYHDDDNQYILAFNGIPQSYFHYNTKLVKRGEIKSYWDFLDPKWKGKIISLDPTMGGAVTGVLPFLYRDPQLGPEFLRRFLSETKLTATRNHRQMVDWLALGKFAIAALAPQDYVRIYEAKEQGLPVSSFVAENFKEGLPLSTSSGNIALINRAPHPNAAKVAINWFLSRKGQMVYQKVDPRRNSLRIDIPKDQIQPRKRRVKGVNYQVLAGPGFVNMDNVNKFIKKVWTKK